MAKIAGQNIPDLVLLGGAALFAAWFLSPGGISTLEHYGLAGEIADIGPQRPPRNPPPSGGPPPPTGGPPRPRPGGQPGPFPRPPPPGGRPGPGPRQPPDWRVPRPDRRPPQHYNPPRFKLPNFHFPRFPWLSLPQSNISYEECVWAGQQIGKDLSECCADAYDLGRNIHLFEVENCLSCGRRDC